jgi:twitching motility protein PilJ
MTTTNNGARPTAETEDLKLFIDEIDYADLAIKISRAATLERSGQLDEARVLYQEILEADPQGTLGASARKALESLLVAAEETTEQEALEFHPEITQARMAEIEKNLPKTSPWQWFYNLPIGRKQLMSLLLAQIVSMGLVGVALRWLTESNLHTQLLDQAKSEVAVTETNYNIKINQMGFGFLGQSKNPAIVKVAQAYAEGKKLTPSLRGPAEEALQQEARTRNIEYATLVGKDMRIIVNANNYRQGEIFNPNNLVEKVLQDRQQIKASAIAPWADLAKEQPVLLPPGAENQDALIRYTITPVIDPTSKKAIGALISGDIVNGKLPIVENTLKAFGEGYSAVYLRQPTGEFALATSLEGQQKNVTLTNPSILQAAANAKGQTVTQRVTIGGQTYTVAAKALPNTIKETGNGVQVLDSQQEPPVAILVRGTPETAVNNLLDQSLIQELAILGIALLLVGGLVILLRRAIVKPIENLQITTKAFSEGATEVRAEIFASDELGQLAATFNQMADSINLSTKELEKLAKQQQTEAEFQRKEKERLQQGVINLLLDIEGAKQGDLTVKAKLDEGEMGSVADAFNGTIASLRELVAQVKTAANQVNDSAFSSEASVEKLAQEATTQANSIAQALNSVEEMKQSIRAVATSAKSAAAIARRVVVVAQEGEGKMEQTASSIGNIRTSMADTSKKMKRLAESSQEISKIVQIITGISEKTNLLAFNASIEASRAGENGQGFRIVAEEVRRLAERVTESAKEIEQFITAMQQETAEVMQTMEASTTQVVAGTQSAAETQQTLRQLAETSKKIDTILQTVSASTSSQVEASQTVTDTMQEVAAIAQTTSAESQTVSSALQQLVAVAEALQGSVSKFQVEK